MVMTSASESSGEGPRWRSFLPLSQSSVRQKTAMMKVLRSTVGDLLCVFGGLDTTEHSGGLVLLSTSQGNLHTGLATSQQWLTLINRTAPDNRLRDHELILRFFALNDAVDDYRPPLKKVLNDYMKKNRSISEDAKQGLRYQFQSSLGNVGAVFANRPFRRIRRTSSDVLQWDTNLNRPVFDIQMLSFVGLPYEEVAQRREVLLERFRDL